VEHAGTHEATAATTTENQLEDVAELTEGMVAPDQEQVVRNGDK